MIPVAVAVFASMVERRGGFHLLDIPLVGFNIGLLAYGILTGSCG